jgi:transglutaminase-like putative cysteine protease
VCGLVSVALGFLAATARGGTNDYVGSNWALVDAAKALAAAAEITTAKYPDSDQATVEGKSVRLYRADGTGEGQDESFVKVLTEKGRRENRTISLGFMLPYSTVAVAKLEVVKPDGQVIPVDVAANSKESIDSSQLSANIADPNSKVLTVNIPQLEIGDVVHSVVRQTTLRPIIPGEFADENIFEGNGYIRHLAYEIHAPAERPLRSIALRDEVPGTVTHSVQTNSDQTLDYHWEVNNVPRMFDEPAMPSYSMVLQRLVVSTTPDWQGISKWYWNLSQSHLDTTTPAMKQKVAELTAAGGSDLDKVHAVFYYVSKNIRYMGLTPEKDRPGFEPHDVCVTFDKQYGVCRDKAALLVSLLRIAGFNAYPVLINVSTKLDMAVPDPYFNHAIAAVELKPGEYVLMDPTDENTRDLLPSYDCDQTYLVCRAEGDVLRISPVPPVDEHLMRVQTTGVLSADGRLEAKSELSFEGVNDDEYRNAFSRMKPDDELRFFERNLKTALPGAKLTSLKLTPTNMMDMTAKLHAELEFTVEGLTAIGGGKAVVSMPWIGKNFGMVNFLLNDTGLEKRKYPLKTELACGLQEDVSIKLADGYTDSVAMPATSTVSDESMDYGQQVAFKDGMIEASRELKLKVVEFPPAQYLKLKQTLKKMEYDGRKNPILATTAIAGTVPALTDTSSKTPVESNAKILESRKKLEVTGPHTAVYSVKYSKLILNYSGKIREAEVKVDFNPACEDAKLVSAVVTSKTGERKEISAGEINVMDQGWNPSAKRYTGGKILVANLPGVEIGSTIEVEFAITMTNMPFLSGYELFQLPDALDKKSFDLSAPANVKIQKLLGGTPSGITQTNWTAGGRQTLQWSVQNVKALPAENSLPPEWNYASGVGYFIGDAGDYFKALNSAMLAHAKDSAKAAATAKDLTAKAPTKLDAVKAIRDYIVKSIRLAGPSFTDLPLSELSGADTTLTDGYGHLADRAILFHAMLAAAGFKPEFVLASGLPPVAGITNVTSSFPLPQSFQTPLVKISVDGQAYYLNDTDQYSQLGTVTSDGKLGIALANEAWETIAAAKNCRNKTETTYSVALTDDGKARITIAQDYYGGSYNGKHRYFAELPPEERNRYHQKIVSDVAQGAQPVGELTTKFDTYPGREEFTVDVDNYGVVDGKYFYFDLPFTPALFPARAGQRALPLFISQAAENSVRTEISLPPGFHQLVIAPQNEDVAVPGGTHAHIARTDSAGKFAMTDQFEIVPAIISPQSYPALLQADAALGEKSSTLFLLEHE